MGSQRWVVEVAGAQHKIRVLHDSYPVLFRPRGELTVWLDGEVIYEITKKYFKSLLGAYPIKIGNTTLMLQVRSPRLLSTQYHVFLEKDGKRIAPF